MIVTRFAPSPTGYQHLGHAFAAQCAAASGDRFLLRIEDIDATRVREEFIAAVFEDLRWLGLRWEEPVLRQSERMDAYRAALRSLEAMGLTYPCFCTRAEIAAELARAAQAPHLSVGSGPESVLYPGTCRNLSTAARAEKIAASAAYAVRLDVTKAAAYAGALTFHERGEDPEQQGVIIVQPGLFGDIVLARKDVPVAYHLAVVVDDAFQNITLVTRGLDLLAATHVQRLLQALLGLPAPDYAHHRLILDETGRKFSKRDHAVTLRALRAAGVTPDDIRKRLSFQ